MADRKFVDDCLRAINEFRTRHQVAPLKHNVQIATIAQKWAEQLGRSNTLGHNPNRSFRGEQMGENVAMQWSSNAQDFPGYSNRSIFLIFIRI